MDGGLKADVLQQWFSVILTHTTYNLFKVESQGTEYIFHIGQVSALYKINDTDSSGLDYRICSH
jgi:hypothetical protein